MHKEWDSKELEHTGSATHKKSEGQREWDTHREKETHGME